MKINWSKGFTLIELLIVIAVLGVLAGGVIVAINPLAKINAANMVKAETFSVSVQNSLAMDLVGEWTFDDGTAKDTSGYGNITTNYGATLTTDRKGQINKAYSLDGINNYIRDTGSSTSLPYGSQAHSGFAWIYPTSNNTANGGVEMFDRNCNNT